MSTSSCAYRWKSTPITDFLNEKDSVVARTALFQTDRVEVGIIIQNVDFPYVSGLVTKYGGSLVEVNLRDANRIQLVKFKEGDLNEIRYRTPVTLEDLERDHSILLGKDVYLEFARRTVILRQVSRVDMPWAEGQIVDGDGPVRVDLRQVSSVSIEEINVPLTVLKSLGIAAAAGFLYTIYYFRYFLSGASF